MIKKGLRTVLYVLLALFMVITFYLIFNAGNPKSLVRYIIKDTSYDITLTVASGVVIVVCALFLGMGKGNDPIKNLLDTNRPHIESLKGKGKSDEEIADSFIKQLKITSKVMEKLIKRKTLRYIARMDK